MAHRYESSDDKTRKRCFVTIGATAPFDVLLSNVLDKPFLEALSQCGYTELLIQYGKEGRAIFEKFVQDHPVGSDGRYGLDIYGFDFNKNGLDQEMKSTKANEKMGYAEGMILSHAGSGSILEALRMGVPLVVVPNPALQDNHQEELAKELSKQGYVVASTVTDIASSVKKAESLRNRLHGWPPVNSGEVKYKRGLAGVMADEMGFID
ncbi:hypothetical protein VTN77DRAFT_3948 [Rasamsonia byssochlamydoides]|uniref:uncharacterized protein n=1 Tax=Rasamsonia byssochlamydoides TaxID=89139 RepID=UPI0037444253